MGISGLLRSLKSIQKPCNLRKFAGQTIGVDAYGWIHKGTVACATDLALEKPTTKFVDFAMNLVRMLIHFGVTPYIVFDGDYLPSKAATEEKRAKSREESKRIGLELHRLGKSSQAHLQLQKAVDVTPEMARQLIEELKRHNILYVVAPYEADAQLAYLERKGIIQGVLSEDSDLLVFGTKRLLTKLDQYGDCIEINRNDFTACKEMSLVGWSDAEFRLMTILSGCDYLASINRIGLRTAYRLVQKHKTIEKIIRMLQFDGQYRVPLNYLENFRRAELTFLHQRVFCPLAQKLVTSTDYGPGLDDEDHAFIGKDVGPAIAVAVANGDLHPMTKKPILVNNSQNKIQRTPWPTSRRHTSATSSDLKSGMSIDLFFKSKRTPLAELDANCFTPSPSQQRLLEQQTSSWSASSAPARPELSRSNTTFPTTAHARVRRQQTASRGATNVTNNVSSAPNPTKRQRLCCENDEEPGHLINASKVEVRQSRFFAATAADPSPSARKSRKKKDGRRKDISIWSDDSVEDIMAGLPDVCDDRGSMSKAKVAIFKDKEQESVDASLTPTSSVTDGREPLKSFQPSTLEGVTAEFSQSNASVSNSATRIESSTTFQSVAETLNDHVLADWNALEERLCCQQASKSNVSNLSKSSNSRSAIPVQRSLKSQLMQQKSMHFRRSETGASDRLTLCGASKSASRKIRNTESASQSTVQPIVMSGVLNVPQSPIASLVVDVVGSEDFIVPNSEAEDEGDISSSSTETPVHATPELDLGRFAYST
ncbi:Rad2 nuclease [Schaereria dolodes]|nr:Rad2 nuclease [Schaereria dolodes]